MNIETKLKEKYEKKEIITICLISHEQYKQQETEKILHYIEGQWYSMTPPIQNYQNYSHTIHPYYLKLLKFKKQPKTK